MLATFAWCDAYEDYVSSPAYQRAIREGNDVIRAVAQRTSVVLLDLSESMERDAAFWSDSRHVNEAGARVMAAQCAAFVEERFLVAGR
jgi:hypothetical protein